jgi:hypothetical protein
VWSRKRKSRKNTTKGWFTKETQPDISATSSAPALAKNFGATSSVPAPAEDFGAISSALAPAEDFGVTSSALARQKILVLLDQLRQNILVLLHRHQEFRLEPFAS